MTEFQKEINISHKYLHLPICNGSTKVVLQMVSEGREVREFDAELALIGRRDWWAYYDVSKFLGKQIILRSVNANMTDAQAQLLDQVVTQSDDLLYIQDLYNERYRPQFHFTPKRGWNNDPNGMVYHNGTWHLFFQHNPFAINWGSMHWGHATSQDLIHWKEQAITLYPCSMDDMAFSGGGLVDAGNTSGFQVGEEEPIILAFTSTGRGECLAISLDNGETFHEYPGNPILTHRGRDPKIIRYEAMDKWIMIVYDEKEDERGYDLYESTDLTHWNWLQHLADWWECPELFSLPVEGNPEAGRQWVVYGSLFEKLRSAFLLGSMDGKAFVPIGEAQIGHAGPHFYAAQVFNGAPDQRIIMLGWLAGAEYPGMPFGNGMTVPLELSLRQVDNLTRLCFNPVKEIEKLWVDTYELKNTSTKQANEILGEITSDLLDIALEVNLHEKLPFRLEIGGHPIVYDPEMQSVSFADRSVSTQPGQQTLKLRVLVDRSVTEVYVDQGWGAFASMTIFEHEPCKVCIEGELTIETLTVHTLQSIWFNEA